MKRVFLGVVLCLVFHVLVAAQSMSHEEEVVRNAYAKLSFLCSMKRGTSLSRFLRGKSWQAV